MMCPFTFKNWSSNSHLKIIFTDINCSSYQKFSLHVVDSFCHLQSDFWDRNRVSDIASNTFCVLFTTDKRPWVDLEFFRQRQVISVRNGKHRRLIGHNYIILFFFQDFLTIIQSYV